MKFSTFSPPAKNKQNQNQLFESRQCLQLCLVEGINQLSGRLFEKEKKKDQSRACCELQNPEIKYSGNNKILIRHRKKKHQLCVSCSKDNQSVPVSSPLFVKSYFLLQGLNHRLKRAISRTAAFVAQILRFLKFGMYCYYCFAKRFYCVFADLAYNQSNGRIELKNDVLC